ncbi:hypothetical protein ALT_3635 [Aspergillus lentulus]|uniref:Uncharacterized protein n=1 Tax=Aspergillus lentulus TaxID=293939 RepID=A0AAN4PGN5_ASPLE|nr:hypothetical protein ALT_3635 [Aspergillus lentulus]GFF67516.1 hypothetical protein IFM60648_02289 [Aspergillus lentulus]GFG05505.1 hypothetical protein IFM61392_03867 [Aspergillus lentulus]
MGEKEEVKELTITRGMRGDFILPTGLVRVNVSEKENLGSLGLGITPPYPQTKGTTAGWPQSASWRSYFKTTAIPRDSVTAVSCVSGFWTPLSRPCLESGVRSFSGGKRGLEEVTVWDAETVCSPWGLEGTHEAVCTRNGEVVRGAEASLAGGTKVRPQLRQKKQIVGAVDKFQKPTRVGNTEWFIGCWG